MKNLTASRFGLFAEATLSVVLLGLAIMAGWLIGYNRATGQLAAERLGVAIQMWESLDAQKVEDARQLLEIEISSAATELFALHGHTDSGRVVAYRNRLRVIAEKYHDAELRQTLLALLGTEK